MPFKTDASKYLKKVIRTRQHLIRSRRSQLDSSLCHKYINYLNYFMARATTQSLASVFIHHKHKILYLIPGKESTSHIKLESEFLQLRAQAISIKHQTSNFKPQTSNIQTQTSNIQTKCSTS